MDKLKNFIDENRQEFEEFKAPEELWAGISQRLKEEKHFPILTEEKQSKKNKQVNKTVKMYSFSRSMLMRVAASVLILLVAGITWVSYKIDALEDDPPLSKTEAYYEQIFHAKLTELKQYENDDLFDRDLLIDIQELEEIYNDLKNDLKEDANNEQVVEAMIRNYRVRIELLEKMLNEIKLKKNPNGKGIYPKNEGTHEKDKSI
ncbi:hypothetical protein [Thermoflexibacter ruber]|uniref:Anti-sigma factor n=1 Tax=Thermoflexibacter ruber TaxID=1003 RepID=A0A1I2HRB1_9BACT|nr:hypothetical protein [Thermoflexibacter ruber]SFF31246.1 hypothetical protein SAMN04488541_102522 [Thermoflexibacter ruber]